MMGIRVKVKTGSKKQEILKTEEGYRVCLKEKAENNKANLELLGLLKRYFGKEVRIARGLKSRNKVVEIK